MLIFIGAPHFIRGEFLDLTSSSNTQSPLLATYTCFTDTYPPTSVSWSRNNVPVNVDGIHYNTIQVVTNRRSSAYKNVFQVYDVTEVLGNPRFTCSMTNSGGTVSHSIQEGVAGKQLHLFAPGSTSLRGIVSCFLSQPYSKNSAVYTLLLMWIHNTVMYIIYTLLYIKIQNE